MMIPLVVFIALLVVAAFAYLSHLQNQKRIAELSQVASELGWSFDASKDHDFHHRFSQFDAFGQGHSRYAHNTIHGHLKIEGEEWSVVAGDYHYKITTNNGKSSSTQTYRFSFAIVELPFAHVPDLSVRAEGFFDKIADFLGFDDIDFESAEFSRRFRVKSSDKKFAYAVIHPRMMEFFLDRDPPAIELSQRHCCVRDGNRRWSGAEFRSRFHWIEQFFEKWPRHVIDDLESRPVTF